MVSPLADVAQKLPKAILVMGVSGCGKSTLGRALAAAIGYVFVEGDDLHPAANVAKMAAGIALDDADRTPWLHRVAAALRATPTGVVVTCSALKRSYRDLVRADLPTPLALVHPVVPVAALRRRMAERSGHYMPPSLLDSQLATLEPPTPDEHVVTLVGNAGLAEMVDAALFQLVAITDATL